VPTVPTGTEGTFSFDVLDELGAALGRDEPYFAIQGRIDDLESGDGSGLQVRTTADGNLDLYLEPQLSITSPGTVNYLTYSIESLPASGSLFDQSGIPITQAGPIPTSRVTYEPDPQFVGLDSFVFGVNDGFSAATAVVNVVVQTALGNCSGDKIYCYDGRP
jgi:hypothetical protein